MTNDNNRVAVVTGANRGLGHSIALSLARRGLHVVLAARNPENVDRVLGNSPAGLSIAPHQCDVTDPASVARLMADVGYEHGRIDVLINNAGIAIDRGQHASNADLERVAATLNVNLMGTWRCCIAAIHEMRRNDYGRIVNVTSHLGTFAEAGAGSSAYRVSKAAMNMLTCVLADELSGENILVNAASPGKVATRLAYGKAETEPDEVADDFAWLATLPDGGPSGKLFYDRSEIPW